MQFDQLKRREFITLLGGAVVVADCGPRVAGALSDQFPSASRSSAVAAGSKGSELRLVMSPKR
jgi:hypothetical protein